MNEYSLAKVQLYNLEYSKEWFGLRFCEGAYCHRITVTKYAGLLRFVNGAFARGKYYVCEA